MEDRLFHVTFLDNIDSISSHGLTGRGSMFGGGYAGHAEGRVFFTEGDGVSFWMNRYEQLAEHHSDDPVESGLIPVVLCVDKDDIGELFVDKLGTRDALSNAYYVTEIVPSDVLFVWDGFDWVPLDEVDTEGMLDVVRADSELIQEDGAEWLETGSALADYFEPNDLDL